MASTFILMELCFCFKKNPPKTRGRGEREAQFEKVLNFVEWKKLLNVATGREREKDPYRLFLIPVLVMINFGIYLAVPRDKLLSFISVSVYT